MKVVDPQGQKTAIKLLTMLVPGIRIGTYYPEDHDGPMLVVNRQGGVMINPITDGVTLTIQAYDRTQAGAEELIGLVRRALLDESWWGLPVRGVMARFWKEHSAPQRFSDPDRPKLVRFQMSGQLALSILTK